MAHAISKSAWAGNSEEHPDTVAGRRLYKTVSFRPDIRSRTDSSNGTSPSIISSIRSGSIVAGRENRPRRSSKVETLTSGSLDGSLSTCRQLSGCTEERSCQSSASITIPQEPAASPLRSRSGPVRGCHAAAPPVRSLSKRIVSTFVAPFRELAGGELNFAWAYKEATAIQHRSMSTTSTGYKTSQDGTSSHHWGSRLSDANTKVSPDLHYFPLRFRDAEAEKEYVAVTNYQCSLRVSIYLLLQHCVLLPIQFSLFFSDPFSRLGSMASHWFLQPLIFAFIGVSVVGLSLAMALLYPWMIPRGGGYFCRRFAGQLACIYSFLVSRTTPYCTLIRMRELLGIGRLQSGRVAAAGCRARGLAGGL